MTGLVRFDLVDDLEHAKFCSSVEPTARRFPEYPLMTCRVVHVVLELANISASIVPRIGRSVDDP